MRVLIVTDKMGLGGAETHIYTLITELLKRKVDVSLLSSGGVFADKLADEGVTCYTAPLDKRNPISILRSKNALSALMKKHEIIHTHTRFTTYLAMKIRGKMTFPTIISTAHLCFPLSFITKRLRWGDGTLAVSEDIKRYLIESYGVREQNIILTRNGIDTNHFDGVRADEQIIVHTSRLDNDRCKCAFLLAKIAPDIHKEFPDAKILIVGDGERYAELKQACDKVNNSIGEKIISAPGGTSDVKKALSKGQIFVGVSRAALEAMAMGLPTAICGNEGYAGIATQDNLSSLIATNFCARGEPFATSDALLKDILTLLRDTDMRKRISEFSRNAIIRHFPSERIADDALSVYRKCYKPMRLCLLGYFGFSNLGDEEMLGSAIRALRLRGINDISVLRKGHSNNFGVCEFNRYSPIAIHRALSGCDALILCGGNLLQNETSMRSLLYYSAIIGYSKIRKKRLYILSSGIGEIRGAIASAIVRRSIKGSSFIGARTHEDKRLFSCFSKPDEKIALMPDFCFLIAEKAHTGKDIYFAIIAARAEFIMGIDIKKIKRETGLTPIGIILCRRLDEKRVLGAFSNMQIDAYAPESFSELSSLLTKCAFTISERLHGSIFSVISHTPTYLLDSRGKRSAFINEMLLRSEKSGTPPIVLPISDSIKKIGVNDSDFNVVLNTLRDDVNKSLNTSFGDS